MAKILDAICTRCLGTTDADGKCCNCAFDWKKDTRTERQKHFAEWRRLETAFHSKEDRKQARAEFLRHNEYGSPVNYMPYDSAQQK